jgi:hypothetical protein
MSDLRRSISDAMVEDSATGPPLASPEAFPERRRHIDAVARPFCLSTQSGVRNMSRSPLRRAWGLAGPGLGLAIASVGLLPAATASAQSSPAKAPAGDALFISPFGEPFRSATGLADWFAGADADHDGILTRKELAADGLRFHARLDADRDGRVDGFENNAYENEVAPEILPQSAAFRSDQGEPGAPAPRSRGLDGASSFGLLDEPQPVRGADRNYDGKITAEEQSQAAGRRFALLDEAASGGLTLPVLQARLEARQAPASGFGRLFRRRPD